MKYLLPLSFIVLLTVSCTRYQFLTVNSSTPAVRQNVHDQFVMENDTLEVIYDFKGENLPVSIRITNKSGRPLLIDWKRSSFIINDEAISLKPEEVTTGAAVSGTVEVGRRFRYSNTRTAFNALTSSTPDVEILPPGAYIQRVPFKLAPDYFKGIPKENWERRELVLPNGRKVKKQQVAFSEKDSPLRFRTYLTLLTEEKGIGQVVEHSFYLAGIASSGKDLPGNNGPWVSKLSIGGNVIYGVVVLGILGGVAVAAWHD